MRFCLAFHLCYIAIFYPEKAVFIVLLDKFVIIPLFEMRQNKIKKVPCT